jgi:hypothetical protein
MEPLSTFCFAALVFLSLPLPLFASAAVDACPSARRSLIPWVWCNAIGGGAAGLSIIASPTPPLAALAVGCVIFIVCGLQMFRCLARTASVNPSTK